MNANLSIAGFVTIRMKNYSNILLFICLILLKATGYPQSWSALTGGGMNDWVYATTMFNGELIAGGKFTSAGGVTANHIARWDGTAWWPLGLGVNGKVNALIVYKGNLVAAGEFTSAGGADMNFIAQWDGLDWNDELGGVSSTVTSLAVIGTDLYVGGYFADADNTPVNYVAKRNSAGWSSLAGGMGAAGGDKAVMALTVHTGELYAGGFFTTAGGVPANHIARWNGTAWSPLGSGISNIVYSLTSFNGNLVAGGLFLSAGGIPANHIASWDGNSWSALGGGMSGVFYQYVFTLTVYNNNLIAGGYFTHSDGLLTNGIARWNGTAWSGMNGGLLYPANVYGAHTMLVFGTDLIVGGLFTSAGGVGVSHIASWSEPIVPVTRNIQNELVPNGTANCYDAIQTITVAGNGTSFLVEDGGTATMIAGDNIVYLPGTKIVSGGYLIGSVTNTGQYCGATFSPVGKLLSGQHERHLTSTGSLLKVYPNPSNDVVYIELAGNHVNSNLQVDVFSIRGDKVISFSSVNEWKHQFSLSDVPAGVYYIRIISKSGTETKKIIKQAITP